MVVARGGDHAGSAVRDPQARAGTLARVETYTMTGWFRWLEGIFGGGDDGALGEGAGEGGWGCGFDGGGGCDWGECAHGRGAGFGRGKGAGDAGGGGLFARGAGDW